MTDLKQRTANIRLIKLSVHCLSELLYLLTFLRASGEVVKTFALERTMATIKKAFLLFLLIPLIKISSAQNGENPLPYVHQESKFDTAPRFPGGPEAMMKYFQDSIHYPEPEKTKGIQGEVFVKFDVTEEGRVVNVQLVNGVPGGPNFAKEAVRIMESMPAWIPASKNGKPVKAEYTLSVPFKLGNKEQEGE